MTPHLHATHVDGCYRCELSKDEARTCKVVGCLEPCESLTATTCVEHRSASLSGRTYAGGEG